MSVTAPDQRDIGLLLPAQNRAITSRSLIGGTIAAVLVCGLTPFNDYVFSDTSLTGGYMPLGAILIEFLLIVAINAPLHRWAPRWALNTGELAVVVLMTLVASSIPNWGLMRFFIPTPVAPFHVGAADDSFWKPFVAMGLPDYLFPVARVADGRTDPAATWFYNRVPPDEKIPYGAWIRPLAVWGVFIAAMLATLTAMARLVIDQWMLNERLPFPLVQVHTALIEPPKPGRALNEIFRSPILWIALGSVLSIHLLSCLATYFPRNVPKIPLAFDLSNILSEGPFYYLRPKLKKAALSFIVIGVTYFIRSRAAFSLWVFYIIVNLVDAQQGMRQSEMLTDAWKDQHLGACIAFVAGILWIGRHHWARVVKNALRLNGTDRAYGRTVWVALVGVIVMVGWLKFMGVQIAMAGLIVLFILTAHMIVARVVAETGLPFYRTMITTQQVYTNYPAGWFSGRDIWFANVFNVLGPVTTRDGLMTFATQGLGVAKNANVSDREERKLGSVIGWTLLVGCVVAAFATLHCQYSYPTPASDATVPQRNYFGAELVPKRDVTSGYIDFTRGRFAPKQHSPAMHMGIGFGVTVFLEFAALRWAGWPLLPVGYVTSYGAFIENAWFSIFIGWLAQLVIVRLGGASLFQRARPFFIGIIFGEALAAGIWLIVNAIIVTNGGDPQTVKFLL